MSKKRILLIIVAIIAVLIVLPSIIFKYVSMEDIVAGRTPDINDDRWKTRESDYDGIKSTYIYMPGKRCM